MLGTILISLGTTLATADRTPTIEIAQAPDFVDRRVTVEFVVRSVNRSKRAFALLNSRPKFSDPRNFSVVILRRDKKRFLEAGFESDKTLIRTFRDNRLRATGVIKLVPSKKEGKKRYELILTRFDDIELPEESSE